MAKTLNTLAEKADAYYLTREARLAKQKEVDALQVEESKLKAELIDSIDKSEGTGVAGKLVRVAVVKKPKPQVKDWAPDGAFWTYVRRRKAFDLVQHRLSEAAVKERWEDGQTIPGVEVFNVLDLSVNKV